MSSFRELKSFWLKRGKKNSLIALGVVGCLAIGALGTTLAANINLNNGEIVEFGQGIAQTTACSGDDSIIVTPYSEFINEVGAGAHYFTSVTLSSIPDSCLGKDFVIESYSDSSDSPLALYDTNATSAVVYFSSLGNFELASDVNGITISSGDGTFTITFTTPVAISSNVSTLTIESREHVNVAPASCADGGDCSVGDTGPGGGIVFFVSEQGFDCGPTFVSTGSPTGGLCHALEVALNNWDGDTGTPVDPRKQLVVDENLRNDISNIANESSAFNSASAIGRGYKNSLEIIQIENDALNAAVSARSFNGGGKSDWYLPVSSELNLLCQWARGLTQNPAVKCEGGSDSKIWDINSGITDGSSNPVSFDANKAYWTSSENGDMAWVQYLNSSGNQDLNARGDSNNVRPIRAF